MSLLVRVLSLWPALAGLGMTVAIIPLTMLLGKLMTAARKDSVAAADARVKLTTEVITGVCVCVYTACLSGIRICKGSDVCLG